MQECRITLHRSYLKCETAEPLKTWCGKQTQKTVTINNCEGSDGISCLSHCVCAVDSCTVA